MFIICRDTEKIGIRNLIKPDRLPQSITFIKRNYGINPEETLTYDNLNELKEYINKHNITGDNIYAPDSVKSRVLGKLTDTQKRLRKAKYHDNKEFYSMKSKEYYKKKNTVVLDPSDTEDSE